MAGPIRIAILGNATSAVGAIHATETATTRLGSRFKSVALAAAKFAAAGVALGGALAVYAAVNFAQAAANDAEQAAILARNLSAAAGATGKQIAATEAWITAQGKAIGISDDQLRPALSKLVIATGSVGKAQRLAALAADVAAARNKDLGSVSEALAKAQQGNLSGLGRLGIATKDAAGKTKTLEEITRDLSETYKGAAAGAADTAAGKFGRMKIALSETAEAIGAKLLPLITDVGNFLLDRGIPAVERFAAAASDELGPIIQNLTTWFAENKEGLADLGSEFLGTAIPALKQTAEIVGQLVGFFAGLPGPVKTLGIEVGIAALVFPRLNSALATSKGALTGFIANVKSAETRTAALAGAARAAGGVAGMALMADGARRANSGLGALETTLGGVATGFAMGGPIGALIGGAGAGLIGMSQAASDGSEELRKIAEQAENARGAQLDLRDSLDQTTGAMTRQARQVVAQDLVDQRLISSISVMGLQTRDVVSAILGNERALKKVNAATVKYATVGGAQATNRQIALSDASINLSAYLGGAIPKFKEAGREIRVVAAGTQSWKEALKGLPKELTAEVKTPGADLSIEALRKLKERFDLTPKQVKTLVEATHAQASAQDVQALIDKINNLHDRTVTVTVVTRRQGRPIGGNEDLGGEAAGRVQAQDFLTGLVVGFTTGLAGVNSAIEKVAGFIERTFNDRLAKIRKNLDKTLDGKALEKALARAEKNLDKQQAKILKGLRDQEKAVRAIGKAQDAANALLDEARDKLQAMKDQAQAYADSIRDSVIEFGNLTGLGGDQGFSTAEQMIELLKAKVLQAQQFAAIIAQLTAAGLNQTAIQQLINAGVEGGLGTAQAILAGGPGAIAQINALQAQLAATGTQLGQSTANTMYGAGLAAAQGLVDGLAANADALVVQATKLAKALIKAVKKALGIASPSRAFKDIGKNTVRGLALGLDDVYVQRQGRQLAYSLEKGFGSPALAAFLEAKSNASRSTVEVKLTATQLDALARGKAIQADLDVWNGVGGRKSSASS